jgi:tetratricopeptide (TPR) repeat protein
MKNNKNIDALQIQAATLIKTKEFDKALIIYEAILEIDNQHLQALTHLPIIYLMNKRFEEAINMINKSFTVVKPEVGDYQNLATAYVAIEDYNNAINSYNKIITINPNIKETYKLLGDAQVEIADHPGALNSYRRALDLAPGEFEQLYDYGVILHINKYHGEALKVLREAKKIDIKHIECTNKIASCLSAVGNYKEAKLTYKRLMEWVPGALGPAIDYASNLWYEGQYDEAIKILKELLLKKSLKKSHETKIKQNMSVFYLANKNFKEGWKYHDTRIAVRNDEDKTKRHDMLKKHFDIDIGGKALHPSEKIIILLDAGLGDIILGLSMLKEFQKIYSNISAEVDHRLVNLFKRSVPDVKFYPFQQNRDEILIDYNLDKFDKGIYWMSLGKYVRQDIHDFPIKPVAFLKPDTNHANKIEKKLKKSKEIICGISWKSSGGEKYHKSTQLENLIPILSIKGIRFLDLQYENKQHIGETAVEKKNLHNRNNISIENYSAIDKLNDIDGLAALIFNCDIVVTSSSVTAHIAGGLGIKTFLFVPFSRGKLWYWHDKKNISVWYPSIRIFKAESANEWGEVFEKIAKAVLNEIK